jgi:pimeloyl-ACP methyl ester carboxylesterase
VIHLAAAEAQRHLDLITLFEKAPRRSHLHAKVMVVDHRAELDLLDLDDPLFLPRLCLSLLFLELELAVIEDLGDRRFRIGRYLDEVEARLFSHHHGLPGWHNADVLAIGGNEADFPGINPAVDLVGLFLLRRRLVAAHAGPARRYAQVLKFSIVARQIRVNDESSACSIARFRAKKKGDSMAAASFDQGVLGTRLAYLTDGGRDELGPCGFFWLGGFMSEMTGTKGEALAGLARATRRPCLRFDYSGHGQSDGLFTDGTISLWLEQAIHMFLKHTRNRRIVVGSSMGGWLALLLARRLQEEDPSAFRRIAGLVLVAPATDMTRDLMWERFPENARQSLLDRGVWDQPSSFGADYPITLKLIDDGERHCLLPGGMELPLPVRILQGTEDEDVPPDHALKTMAAIKAADVSLTLVKGGDHRLSAPHQLRLLEETVQALAERADGKSV